MQVVRRGRNLALHSACLAEHQMSELWQRGSPGAPKYWRCKKIAMLFSYIIWSSAMKFNWHNGGHWCMRSRSQRILANFGSLFLGAKKSTAISISRTLLVGVRQNFGSVRGWPIETYSPKFVNFGPGVPRCHAATCISPSLMHWF